MIEAKRLKNLIGQGVAIECYDGFVKKFKVLAVKTTLDKDGEHLDLVKLDVPGCLRYLFRKNPVRNQELEDGVWVYPIFLYKNKGECARQRFEEKIRRAAKVEEDWKETVASHEKDLEAYKKMLQKATDEREELEVAYKKCKFKLGFLKKKCKSVKTQQKAEAFSDC